MGILREDSKHCTHSTFASPSPEDGSWPMTNNKKVETTPRLLHSTDIDTKIVISRKRT